MDAAANQQLECLGRSDLLSGVPASGLQQLQMAARQVLIPRHEAVYQASDPPIDLYIVCQGLVCVAVPVGASRNVVVSVHGPGRGFGWAGLLGYAARVHSTLALADTIALAVPIATVRDRANSDSEFAAALHKNIAAMAFRTLVTAEQQLKGTAAPAENIERCPAGIPQSFFTWRLNGTLIEAKCPGRPECAVTATSCPMVHGPKSSWSTLMLGKYSSVSPTGEPVIRSDPGVNANSGHGLAVDQQLALHVPILNRRPTIPG